MIFLKSLYAYRAFLQLLLFHHFFHFNITATKINKFRHFLLRLPQNMTSFLQKRILRYW